MRSAWNKHPNLLSWAGLALGMVIIVGFSARNVGFQPVQWAAIIGATIILAGLCVWIVSWEDDAEEPAAGAVSSGPEEEAAGQPAGRQAAAPRKAARNGDL